MARSQDALLKIKSELQQDPGSIGYASARDAATKAILMNKPISKSPSQTVTRPANVIDILSSKNLTARQLELISDFVVLNGILLASDVADVTTEIFTSRSEILGLGKILQGEVEQALK